MKYLSTRGDAAGRGFSEILLEGLAPDGGLYLPERYPRVDAATLARWRRLPLPGARLRAALALHRRHAAGRPARAAATGPTPPRSSATRASCRCGRSSRASSSSACRTGRRWRSRTWRCSSSATRSSTSWRAAARTLNVLGATSGDTGSAAEHALRGKRGITVFMLSPHGRMSPFQQAQMFSLQDREHPQHRDRGRVRRLPGPGQGGLGRPGVQAAPGHRHGQLDQLGAACWPRSSTTSPAASQATGGRSRREVDFAVPTGNFGNICAGHIARQMGLPIRRLVLATNENDVLDEFFRTGRYRVRSAAETHETSSPSMDISKASNFERFVFDAVGRDPTRTRALFAEVEERREFSADRGGAGAPAGLRLRERPQHRRRPAGDDPPGARDPRRGDRPAHRRRPQGRRASTPSRARRWSCSRPRCRPSSAPRCARRSASSRRGRRASPASRRCRGASWRCRRTLAALKALIAENA